MNKILAGALFAAVTAVGACSGLEKKVDKTNPAPCPNVVVLDDAARIIEFVGEERLEDVAYTGEITGISSTCRYFADRPIDAKVKVDLALGKGPKGEDGRKLFKYWVAITRKDLEVIAKKEFFVEAKFSDDRDVVAIDEEIDEIVIPRAGEGISGENFEIVVGFVLTPEQAIFNRSGKSLKFPNLQ